MWIPTLLASLPLLAPLALSAPPTAWVGPQPAPLFALDDEDEDEEEQGPTKAEVEAMVERIEEAFKGKTEVLVRVEAVRAAAAVPHDDVAKALRDALGDKESEVTLAALDVLGKMPVEEALDELLRFHKKDRRLKKDDELLAESFKAIARHGDPDTAELFTDNLFSNTSDVVVEARILGLGMIRDAVAVEGLMDVLKATYGKKGGNQPKVMPHLVLSMTVLIGEHENGSNKDKWVAWWNDNKRDLEISAELPEVPAQMLRKWQTYWGLETDREKGDDPRGGGSGR